MKYQNLASFEKHLQQASKVHISRLFLIVTPCSYERRKIAEKVIAAIRSQHEDFSMSTEDGSIGDIEERIDRLNTSSLFSGQQLLYLDNIDKLKKNALSLLADYAAHPSPFSFLLLGASSSKGMDDFYAKGKKELIVCDLSTEKPWDRKDRIKRQLVEKVQREGKRFHADAVESLLDRIGVNLPSLEQEVDKLVTYAAGRSEVTIYDVQALCASQKSESMWQIAEAIVWKEHVHASDEAVDFSLLLPLISQVRTQLQHGMCIAALLVRGAAQAEISHQLPSVKPAALDRMLPIARARKSPFFRRALNHLFEIELMAKNGAAEPELLYDLILAKIHALSVAQSAR